MELLVVIAIIAVLAALLIPTGMGILKKSRQATSVGQVKSLCAGLMGYIQDNGRYPMGFDDGSGEVWDLLVAPDAKGLLGLRAPLDTLQRSVGSQETRRDPRKWRSYSMVRNRQNGVVLGVAGRVYQGDRQESKPVALVSKPSETLLLVERFDPTNLRHNLSGAVIDKPQEQITHGAALTIPKTVDGEKRPTFVYGFCDGSVRILTPQETIGKGTLDKPRGMWTFEDGD